ncbi:hypothetical protein C2G38_1597924 [Gigaspora rosea]|uniref:Uncharacterized protein n=1 Tax=Gigaspora rosea TaxID=44941 RepID=A0A397UZQ3_9GLOM|nr:hypothetical protein C2G38_1597924 [Gigaspora rosea]
MAQQPSRTRISRPSGNISFNNPSAPGIHNFRISLSESTEQQPNPLRVAFLEYQIACLNSRLSSLTQENNNLRSEVATLKAQMETQEISHSISFEKFLNDQKIFCKWPTLIFFLWFIYFVNYFLIFF